MGEKKELEVIERGEITARPDVLSLAIEKGVDTDQLEKLMALQERYEANEARKAYHVAMTAFKADPPMIDKDASVKYGQTSYNHATLANVTNKINKALSEHGLSAAWETSQSEKEISVKCKITHISGHSESTTLKAGADTSGAKNSIQAIGSTVTYLQRYTILSLTGLATAEMDDDGAGSEAEYINEEQIRSINELIIKVKADFTLFKSYMKVEDLGRILSEDYNKAIGALNAKAKK